MNIALSSLVYKLLKHNELGLDRGTTLLIVACAMTDMPLDFWAEHSRAEYALEQSMLQLDLPLDDLATAMRLEWLNKCLYVPRASAESNAFWDHWRKCSGCFFCGVLVLQQ